MIRKAVGEWEYRYVPFILVPRDNRLPIRKMSVQDCISSHDPQFGYGYPIWTHGGKSNNPFYWMNESVRYYFNKATKNDDRYEYIEDGEEVPMIHNFFNDYNKILREWHENWILICQELLDHHDESISIEFKNFKVVSNIDTSFMDFND